MKSFLTILFSALSAIFLLAAPSFSFNLQHDCLFCHDLHGASAFNSLLQDNLVEAICLSCHGPGGISTLVADVHKNKSRSDQAPFRYTCIDCHDSHDGLQNWMGGTNIKLVGVDAGGTYAEVTTLYNGVQNIVFESRGSTVGEPTLHSFADNDEDNNGVYDGPCEVCHTLTRYHRNNPSGIHTHNTGETCTTCHGHQTNFIRR